jgi:hypothetical protein
MTEHYLVSVEIGRGDKKAHIHAYVMTNDKERLNDSIERMMDIAESKYGPILLPIILQTTLSTSVDLVRSIIIKHSPELKESFENTRLYHFTLFIMSADHPDDKLLMELH